MIRTDVSTGHPRTLAEPVGSRPHAGLIPFRSLPKCGLYFDAVAVKWVFTHGIEKVRVLAGCLVVKPSTDPLDVWVEAALGHQPTEHHPVLVPDLSLIHI